MPERNIHILQGWSDMMQPCKKTVHDLFFSVLSENTHTDIVYYIPQECHAAFGQITEWLYEQNTQQYNNNIWQCYTELKQKIRDLLTLQDNRMILVVGRVDGSDILQQANPAGTSIPGSDTHFICRRDGVHTDDITALNNLYHDESLFDEVYYWPTYWMCRHLGEYVTDGWSYPPRIDNITWKYLYACKNGKNHDHRAVMVDCLHRYGLQDLGIITYSQRQPLEDLQSPDRSEGPLRLDWWTEQQLFWPEVDVSGITVEIDTYDTDMVSDWHNPEGPQGNFTPTEPEDYFATPIDIVTESNVMQLFITEKTLKPILCEKPFVCLAAPGYHALLKSMGFKLYDELFDYAFDALPDWRMRAENIAFQLHNISRIVYRSNQTEARHNLDFIWQSTRDIAKHNLIRLCEILLDNSYTPTQILQKVLPLDDTGELAHYTDMQRAAQKILLNIKRREI